MGERFIRFEEHDLDSFDADIVLQAFRAQYTSDVTAPQLGQQSTWKFIDTHINGMGIPIAQIHLYKTKDKDDDVHSVNIWLYDNPEVPNPMTDAEATKILAWAEKLCSATAKELTPWLNDADRRPHDEAKGIITKIWSKDADLWKCPFARIMVYCNPAEAKDQLLVVRNCRRAVVSGYTPCSEHMWDHKDPTHGDRVEIVNRWGKEALVRRLVKAFRTRQAANDDDDDESFGAVRKLLALYLYVSAITQGRKYPDFKNADTHNFREEEDDEGNYDTYTAVFVKSLHS